ncbi:hypothetical protein HMF7854_10820 [Sphingomonas ginkgonis]|uniref:Uncharacterized protein n=1 Tax=Sphingomonas ginkgonis TaxID=2315330 RepID=A0A429VBS9_9SPHN|nr:hypothetical protein [Sphingomonas ginkgonis]RST31272.1 hypothetical protein HMF7854_10820 [Sphingomonas ginkgonis]
MFWIIVAADLAGTTPLPSVRNLPTVSGFEAPALTEDKLAATTARGTGNQNATSTLNARSSNNSVNGSSVTGTVTFSDSSFQNASGLTMVNANSGNNVAINSAMTLNIAIIPAP